ncbi:hypothetical protein H5410_020437 [Solanum commersonii]|uniref:Uncharacterized protein n=1 Tax=Solanum commersonii TaxID=4109 RepID=A0A9J5ZCE5_SOLCO|nr:hypothetical protein H5410_020437 [Solanum commersonii]
MYKNIREKKEFDWNALILKRNGGRGRGNGEGNRTVTNNESVGRRDAADVQENGENKKQHEVKKEQDEKKEEDINNNNNNNNNNNKDDQYSSSSSPRGVLETPPLGLSDSDNSSISSSDDRSSNFASSPSGELSQGVYWKNIFDQIKRRSMRRLSSIPLLGYEMILPKNIRRILSKNRSAEEEANDSDDIPKPSWRNFSYGELVEATDSFSPGTYIHNS